MYNNSESVGVENMQVNAISSYNKGFTGKRDNIDGAIAQDDRYVREYAYLKAMHDVKDKKHKKLSNALWYSIPAVAGLSAAILTKGKVSLFGKEIGGLASKLTAGIAGALPWAITLGVADAVVGANNLALKKSENFREAERKHPILSFLGILAAGVAALTVLPKGLSKLAGKIGPKTYERLGKGVQNLANVINKVKTPGVISKPLAKLSEKTPAIIKNGAKTGISLAPTALLLTSFFHSINHNVDKRREFEKNYSAMKDTQLKLAQARVNELKLQNDFLMQTPENQEDLAILKEPLKDMPEEVIVKVEEHKTNPDEIVIEKTEIETPVDKDFEITETEKSDEISSDNETESED